jgi:hypothetical protein
VAVFAEGVERGFCLRRRAVVVVTTVTADEFALMMAGRAVCRALLMSGVVEGDGPHARIQSDFGGTLVGGDNHHGSRGNQTYGKHYDQHSFHNFLLWVMVLCCQGCPDSATGFFRKHRTSGRMSVDVGSKSCDFSNLSDRFRSGKRPLAAEKAAVYKQIRTLLNLMSA